MSRTGSRDVVARAGSVGRMLRWVEDDSSAGTIDPAEVFEEDAFG